MCELKSPRNLFFIIVHTCTCPSSSWAIDIALRYLLASVAVKYPELISNKHDCNNYSITQLLNIHSKCSYDVSSCVAQSIKNTRISEPLFSERRGSAMCQFSHSCPEWDSQKLPHCTSNTIFVAIWWTFGWLNEWLSWPERPCNDIRSIDRYFQCIFIYLPNRK